MIKSDIENYFDNNNQRLIHKWQHYFDIYEKHFNKYRDKEIVVVEIGVSHGGSLQMWKSYFGKKAKIFGIDVDPRCKEFEEDNIKVLIGSQSDRNFLNKVKETIPKIDILIDDGGHTMNQQIISFEELFPHISENGIYLCEDVHTSYRLRFGGGHKRRGTFMEFSKNLLDDLNAYHSEQRNLKVTEYTKSLGGIHFYDSIVVFDKKKQINTPYRRRTGKISFEENERVLPMYLKITNKLVNNIIAFINIILRKLRLPGFIWK